MFLVFSLNIQEKVLYSVSMSKVFYLVSKMSRASVDIKDQVPRQYLGLGTDPLVSNDIQA